MSSVMQWIGRETEQYNIEQKHIKFLPVEMTHILSELIFVQIDI